MPDEPLPGVSVTTYVFDAFMLRYQAEWTSTRNDVGMYLLDLVTMQDFRVVSGVTFDEPAPEGPVDYPPGWCVLRAMVDVQEWDVEVELVDDDAGG